MELQEKFTSIPFSENKRTASVNKLSCNLIKQNNIDLRFNWHIYTDNTYTDTSLKISLEFRDLYNRLIFAIAILNNNEFAYAVNGENSDSEIVSEKFEPKWKKVAGVKLFNNSCQVHLIIDFTKNSKKLNFELLSIDGQKLFEKHALEVNGLNLAQIIAVNYSHTKVPISHNIYDIQFSNVDSSADTRLFGKSIYAFGDSIVNGHMYSKKGFVDFIAQQEGMNLSKYAVNGGSILPGKLSILQQIYEAPKKNPNFIIFNGGTNDAYKRNEQQLGNIQINSKEESFDAKSYAGSLEKIMQTMRKKWDKTNIIFVAVPKLCSRDMKIQEKIHTIQKEACKKWDIKMMDMFTNSALDTNIDEMRRIYTFDDLGEDNLPGTMNTAPNDDKTPSGTHPNFLAIEKYYVPELLENLHELIRDGK